MKKRTLRSIVPVVHRYNSIYLQAQMMHRALGPYYDTSPGLALAKQAAPADVTLVDYGSFDPQAWELSGMSRVAFVFHGITPPTTLFPWNPLGALRSLAGYAQLHTLRKTLPWVGLSGSSVAKLSVIGFQTIEESSCIVPRRGLDHAETESPARSRALVFVGRISPNKKVLELLEIFGHIYDRHPETSLWIVGTHKPDSWYGKLFARSLERHRARKNIVWHSEPLRFSDLQNFYRRALLYVSCSSHEGFGVPVMEAISWSTPAIYARCGGTDSVLDGAGLMTATNPKDRAAEIVRLIDDEQERDFLLSRQRAALPRFLEEQVGERLAGALDRLCD